MIGLSGSNGATDRPDDIRLKGPTTTIKKGDAAKKTHVNHRANTSPLVRFAGSANLDSDRSISKQLGHNPNIWTSGPAATARESTVSWDHDEVATDLQRVPERLKIFSCAPSNPIDEIFVTFRRISAWNFGTYLHDPSTLTRARVSASVFACRLSYLTVVSGLS